MARRRDGDTETSRLRRKNWRCEMAKATRKKTMRVWVDCCIPDEPYAHTDNEPRWDSDGPIWTGDQGDDLPCLAKELFKPLPRGNTLYEYEVTAKLVKKIRPPKK